MVQDYYHDLSSGLLKARLEPGGESDPIPDGALINGLNVYDCASSPNRLCHNATATLPVFDLAPNQSHRLRVINVGAFAWFEISLDEHSMAITEADGTATEPMETSQLHISPGQRYSVIVDADHQEATSFWLRAKMITNCFSDPSLPPNGANEARAIVRYSKESEPRPFSPLVSQPTSRRDNIAQAVICRDMESKGLVPVPSIPAPATADHTYHLRTNMEIGNWRLQRGVFNHSSFRPNLKSPSLHRVVGGLRVENTTLHLDSDGLNSAAFESKHELVIQHSGIKVVDLIIQNMDEGSHPMHLHGHKFWVLGQGHAYFPGYDKLQTELSNPLRRDTAAVEGFGWMLIRFVTDNPGMWTFHCHMAWHGEAGLAMQFLSQPEVMATWDVPDANLRLCEADGLEKGAAPKDEIWYGHGS
jgi:FtsP/CotA-like multicopper oxidase with cupredoxin domain